jgi:DNA gyrase/topoisomerase IV subunit A
MSYSPVDVIDASIAWLKSDKEENRLEDFILHPYIRGIKNKYWKYEDGHWVNYGDFTYNDKKKEIIITELPFDVEFAKFEKLLNKLVENEDIKDWSNYSTGDSIEYHIDCKKGKFGTGLKGKNVKQKIENKFKLRTVVPDDNLWILDENNKIHNFKRATEFIEYFTNWRLGKYNDRKSRLVKILEEKYEHNSELVKFIELICKGKLKIRNRSKVDIKTDMDSYKLPMSLISTPMSKVTIEERDELLKENEAIKKELDYIKKTTITDMYIKDLEDLKKDIEKDFK